MESKLTPKGFLLNLSYLTFEEIKNVSECYLILKKQNIKFGNFDNNLLDKMLQKAVGRIIRKAKKQSFAQINFYKKNLPESYSKLAFIDKILILVKAII